MADAVQDGINLQPTFALSSKFANMNRLILDDMNQRRNTPTFSRYTKEEIQEYISNPYKYEKQLRDAVIYIYGASSHFRRIIQFFVGLSDLSYIISPYGIDPKTINAKTLNRNYRKTLSVLSAMDIKTQFPKILTVCLREDTFYGTMLVGKDNITIQQLPSDYCAISSIEGNVLNVSFNFSYFDTHPMMLDFYPEEFGKKYGEYQKNRMSRWIELDSPTSFAIKVNDDILAYSLPPFIGILRELYDLEDYKQLKLTKTALENYAMLVMTLPYKDGEWGIDYDKAKEFWSNLDHVTPDEIGTVLSPMDISKISFEKSNTGDTNTIVDAEQNVFTSAGVSSLLFNNEKASANALALSIKADQALTFGIVKSIEDMVNRYIHSLSHGKMFKVTFLDVSPYNRKEVGDAYLKAASYGLPTISQYAASQGLAQAELDAMSFLETDVLELQKMFKPLISSNQAGSTMLESESPTDEGGRPPSEDTDLTESGEQTREDGDDWG